MESKTENKSGELIPPEGDDRVGYKIFEILDEVLQDKDDLGLPAKWNRNYELTRNKHWKRTTKKTTLVTANLIYNHRLRTVNMLTDNNPTFNIAKIGAEELDNEEVYTAILKTCEHWWHDTEQQNVLESSVNNGEEQGVTIEKIVFNPDLDYGQGEVETQLVSAFNIGFYPVDGKTDVQKKEAVLHYQSMSLREAKRMWPEHKDAIQADSDLIGKIGDNKKEISANSSSSGAYLATFSSVVKKIEDGLGMAGDPDSEDVLIVECWVRDYSEQTEVQEIVIEDQPVLDDYGEPLLEEIVSPMYRGFVRCIRVCNGGELVLDDRDNPSISPDIPIEQATKTYLFDKYPFSVTPSVTDTSSIWGMDDYSQLEQLNLEVNKALSQITMIKDKAARLKIINPKNSGVNNSEFTNYPGIINPVNEAVANAIRYMETPQVPIDLYKVVEMYKDMFYIVSGAFELERAQTPGREVIAYKAIAALLERASTMLKGKLRNYSKMIRIRGRMYVSHVQNWYTEERWITYEENGEDIPLSIRGTDMIFPAKITVVSGSTMPRAQIQEREEAIELRKLGVIDNEELLKKMDWPDRKNVVRRMNLGPFGQLFEKMSALGMPDELIQYFKKLSEIEDKKFQRSMERGELPPFQQVLQQVMSGTPQEEEQLTQIETAEIQQKNAEIQIEAAKAEAEIAKKQMEAALLREKMVSERVDQWVKSEGVGFDREKLALMRAEFIKDMNVKAAETKIKAADVVVKDKARVQGPYREKGITSNNKV